MRRLVALMVLAAFVVSANAYAASVPQGMEPESGVEQPLLTDQGSGGGGWWKLVLGVALVGGIVAAAAGGAGGGGGGSDGGDSGGTGSVTVGW